MNKFALGLDFGTESARAVLVDVATGEIVATAVEPYPDGVLDEALPDGSVTLAPDWALQNSVDWLTTLEATVKAVLGEGGIASQDVVGIGIDFTACTVVPTTADGMPLHALEAYRNRPHAWVKLWKHHAAQSQADRVNELASERGEPWLARYGGKISSEWLIPKALHILEEDPEIYTTAGRIVEGGDWVVWQLTGELARNACAAGYKATWHKSDGFPSADFLATLHPDLAHLYREKVQGPIAAPGRRVGGLTEALARRLGLAAGTPVAAPIIDAHAAVPGGGVTGPGTMYMIMGTSTCHMLMSESEKLVEGIAGVVEDGIVPGLFGYEAGQAGVGDIFAWFVENSVPPAYHREAESRGVSLHAVLTEYAQRRRPGETGLLALDWWNGNRSTLVDAELSGLLVGATLGTKPEDIYRALIEATAFGTRVIIEAFTGQGVPVEAIVAGGGLTENPLLMQIYADVTGRQIDVAGSGLASALGAAMLGAVAAGRAGGGYDTLAEAAANMAPSPEESYRPNAEHRPVYDVLYDEYRRLYDYFGRGDNNVMKVLRKVRMS
ncbi:MAG: ribulokinase [Anaerolineae bacterium]